MFGRFFYGECSLSEAFWKFAVLGLTASGFMTQLFMRWLKQTVHYNPYFFRVLMNNISLLSMNTTAFVLLCCYIASFLGLVVYSIVCVGGMWNTYKEYQKSKTLAMICMLLVWALSAAAIKFAIY